MVAPVRDRLGGEPELTGALYIPGWTERDKRPCGHCRGIGLDLVGGAGHACARCYGTGIAGAPPWGPWLDKHPVEHPGLARALGAPQQAATGPRR